MRLRADAVLCIGCGYNLETGKKLKTAHKPFRARWDGDMPMALRMTLFVLFEIMCLPTLAVPKERLEQHLGAGIGVFCTSLCMAFALGSFTSATLTRDRRGKVALAYTRWLFFIPINRKKYDPRRFHNIAIDFSGGSSESFGLAIILGLCFFGVLPAVLYWWLMYGGHYKVALAREGSDPLVIYQGRSEARMRDVADTFQRVASLRIG